MNKYVKQTIKNLKAAGFKVKAWIADEYVTFKEAEWCGDYTLVAFEGKTELGGVYIVSANPGLEAISDYSVCLDPYIVKE